MTSERPLTPEKRQQLLEQYRAERGSARAPEMRLIEALRADWPPTIEAWARDELAAELLTSGPIHPFGLERALTAVRRRLLLGGADEQMLPFLARFATQGHLNEYVWFAGDDEAERVRDLAGRVATLGPVDLMLLAAYVPLARLPEADRLLARTWAQPVAGILKEQIEAPQQERARVAQIQALTSIRPGVSEAVRGQYEAHPYPRWCVLPPTAPVVALYGVPVAESPEILIAGCGTGYQAVFAAQRFPTGRVTAVDLSLASLAYGQRLAEEAGRTNIAFFQADILEMGGSEARYDIVESTGVLHHMADPFEGARAISNLLKPGGLIKIGLYSAIARARLGPAKAFARAFTPATLRQMRRAIADAPPNDPVHDAERLIDFYAASPCRDLLMHVQEHEMSFEDLRRILADNGLTFLGFSIDPEPLAAYREFAPHDVAGTDLDAWEAFERANPQTFLGMYQFWARKPA